jgi:hypothetical protein
VATPLGEWVEALTDADGGTDAWAARPVAFSDPVCVGLAVCSNVSLEPTTAAFEGVTVTELTAERY